MIKWKHRAWCLKKNSRVHGGSSESPGSLRRQSGEPREGGDARPQGMMAVGPCGACCVCGNAEFGLKWRAWGRMCGCALMATERTLAKRTTMWNRNKRQQGWGRGAWNRKKIRDLPPYDSLERNPFFPQGYFGKEFQLKIRMGLPLDPREEKIMLLWDPGAEAWGSCSLKRTSPMKGRSPWNNETSGTI